MKAEMSGYVGNHWVFYKAWRGKLKIFDVYFFSIISILCSQLNYYNEEMKSKVEQNLNIVYV